MTSVIVTISSVAYDVYANVATADEYLNASISSQAATWRDATVDQKARGLVEATRWLDQIDWLGDKTESTQELEWPRSSTGVDGVEDTVVPAKIINACIELAALFLADSDLKANLSQSSTKRLKAGSVEIEYFRGKDVETTTALPTLIMPFVRSFISSTDTSAIISYGTDRLSDFASEDDYGFNRGI